MVLTETPFTIFGWSAGAASVFINEVNGNEGKRRIRFVGLPKSYLDGDERK